MKSSSRQESQSKRLPSSASIKCTSALLICAGITSGCGTMIFHNGPTPIALQATATDSGKLSAGYDTPVTIEQNATRPKTDEAFEHNVKTSENLLHYISGQSTTAISLNQWCSPHQWRAFKTEQSAVDMIVRWIASPLYAMNSLALSCDASSEHDPSGPQVPSNLANRGSVSQGLPVN